MSGGYDLVGDVHGHADELEALLRTLGYRRERGAWRHPERTLLFVGDFLDRGPKIRETLRLVRDMLEAGSARAVLGNHEWNTFCFHAEDPDAPGEHLRRHSEKNFNQVAATLTQVPRGELASHLEFLKSLPVRLGLRRARLYHWALLLGGLISAALYVILTYHTPWQWLFLLAVPLFLNNGFTVWRQEGAALDPMLRQLSLSSLLFVILFGVGQLL